MAYSPLEIPKRLVPEHEKLWYNGGAVMANDTLSDGRIEAVPRFGRTVSVESVQELDSIRDEIYHQEIGRRYHYNFAVSDGERRAARLYLPNECDAAADFVIHFDTAWFTGLDGHNDDVAQTIMKSAKVPVIVSGPENSGDADTDNGWAKNTLSVYKASFDISQAKSAEVSMAMAAKIIEDKELPKNIVKLGESRGANHAMMQGQYAADHGIEIPYYDLTDPSAGRHVFSSFGTLLRLAQFPISEVAGLSVVGTKLRRQNKLQAQRGTVPINLRHLMSAGIGNARALGSGEAGQAPRLVSEKAGIHLLHMLYNSLADIEVWQEGFSNHPNFKNKTLHDIHFGLADSSVPRHILGRCALFNAEFTRVDSRLDDVDWEKVHLGKSIPR